MTRQVVRRRGVRAARCKDCGAETLTALSESGLDVVLGTAPLSPVGELHAVLAGVSTYSHHVIPSEVHYRSPWSITHRPAGTRPRQTVHPIHRCGETWQALTPARGDPGPQPADDSPPY